MSSWQNAKEEKLTDDLFCEHCQQEVPAGESIWVSEDGDMKCSKCREKSIKEGK